MTTAVHSVPALDAVHPKSRSGSGMAWALFLLLNATLFMRPAEILPPLEGLPIYETLIVGCLLLSLPLVTRQLTMQSLRVQPITACVIGMLGAVIISHLAHRDLWSARLYGIDFVKVLLYYLLLVSLVNSPRRLRQFMLCLAVSALWLCTVALLRYHNFIGLESVAPMAERQAQIDPATGEQLVLLRLVAAGIYGNPNDLARIIIIGITVCLFGLQGGGWASRMVLLLVTGVFVYSLTLTYSRGGLLALLAGLAVLFHARYGLKKSIMVALVFAPAALYIFAGRQLDIDPAAGTAQTRIKLWSEGLVALRSSPLFGVGVGNFLHIAGNHAHNSFVETYVETGFFGGTFFTSASYLATTALYRLNTPVLKEKDPELARMRPYVLSLVVGSIVGQFSSARGYALPTYMVLGLASVYLSLAARHTPSAVIRVSSNLFVRLLVVSIVSLALIHLYTKANARF